MSGDISATSSRKIVPVLAISNAPGFSLVDPVNAPFSCPNNSFSRISFGSAAQFSAKNGPFERSLFACMARATSSLPVPDSPRINTLASADVDPTASTTPCISTCLSSARADDKQVEMQGVVDAVGSTSADASVLILGESGTGKELVARAMHAK